MRYRATAEGPVPFTPEEEAAFEAEILERQKEAKTVQPTLSAVISALAAKGIITEEDLKG